MRIFIFLMIFIALPISANQDQTDELLFESLSECSGVFYAFGKYWKGQSFSVNKGQPSITDEEKSSKADALLFYSMTLELIAKEKAENLGLDNLSVLENLAAYKMLWVDRAIFTFGLVSNSEGHSSREWKALNDRLAKCHSFLPMADIYLKNISKSVPDDLEYIEEQVRE
jgi:hypothetical protein